MLAVGLLLPVCQFLFQPTSHVTPAKGCKPTYAARGTPNPPVNDTCGGATSSAPSRLGFKRPTETELLLSAAQVAYLHVTRLHDNL